MEESPDPIFIVGSPRSGTSLLRVMLNRHPAIGLCDETHFFYYVHSRQKAFGDLKDIRARRQLVKNYLSLHRIQRTGLDLGALEQILLQEGENYRSFFLAILRFYAEQHSKRRYGEKTPHHALNAETLCRWFPGCRLLHLVRDPRDVVSSLIRMPWGSKNVITNAQSWLKYVQGAERVSELRNYKLVRYEDILLQPELELQRICTFIGEDYSPTMLDSNFLASEQQVPDEWWFQRAKEPLDEKRLGRWRDDLETRQAAQVEWLTGEQMKQFGYEPESSHLSAIDRTAAILSGAMDSLWNRISNPGRLWYYWVQPTRIAQEEAWIDGRR